MTDIKQLSDLADELFAAQTRVEELQAELKAAQQAVQRLAEFTIPEAMDDLGVTELKTSSGLVVTVGDEVKAGDLKRPDGLAWLRKIGEGGAIKTMVGVPFSAGSEADADQFVERLAGEGFAATKTAAVNHMTLKSIIRKKLQEGEEVPMEQLNAHQFRQARVKPAKK